MADFARPEQHLPLKIGQRDVVVVDDRQTADARRREILDHRRAYAARSEEHTSELQSLMRISYAVFCLKKKNMTVSANNAQRPSRTKSSPCSSPILYPMLFV